MKTAFLLTGVHNGAKRIAMGLVFAVAAIFPHQDAMAQNPAAVNLGTAGDFAVLAGSTVTDVPGSSSIINGDVGVYPGSATTGLTAGQVTGGTIYTAGTGFDGLLVGAKNNLTAAYIDAGNRPVPGANAYGVTDNQLGGKTLFPGVYSFGHAATANLIGTLTLDANGVVDPVWIFQASSDLVTGAGAPGGPNNSTVNLINGATSCDVFWWVGSSATIGTYSDFAGNIMADQSISMQTGATLDGSALAQVAAVTLDHNTITLADCTASAAGGGVPDTGSTLLLLGSGLAALLVFRRRFSAPA